MMARSAGSHAARPGSPGNARSRSACCRASVSGRYGMLPPAGTARPASTLAPPARASAASSLASRDLPIPASPVRNTILPMPLWAAPSADRSRPDSASRPMSTGHRRSATRSLCSAARSARPWQPRLRTCGPTAGYVRGYVFLPASRGIGSACVRPRGTACRRKCVAGYAFLPMRLVSGPATMAKATGTRPGSHVRRSRSCQEHERERHGNRQRTGRAVGPRGA